MKKLKQLRKQRKMTQKELASMLNKTVSSVQKYELGIATPSLKVLSQIAEIFEVSLDELTDQAQMPQILKKEKHMNESERAKEILLKQMELLQEQSKMANINMLHELADVSRAMAEMALAIIGVDVIKNA